MSVKVDLAELARVLADFDTAYLISVGGTGRAKVISIKLRVDGDTLTALNDSRGTAANLAENAGVTVLCPPREPGGLSLLVDGTASTEDEGFRIVAEHAILHRPA